MISGVATASWASFKDFAMPSKVVGPADKTNVKSKCSFLLNLQKMWELPGRSLQAHMLLHIEKKM